MCSKSYVVTLEGGVVSLRKISCRSLILPSPCSQAEGDPGIPKQFPKTRGPKCRRREDATAQQSDLHQSARPSAFSASAFSVFSASAIRPRPRFLVLGTSGREVSPLVIFLDQADVSRSPIPNENGHQIQMSCGCTPRHSVQFCF